MTAGPAGLNHQPARIDPIRAGLLCRCPNCGKGPLFTGFLKVAERCRACSFDFTRLNTGDGAAVFVMQIAGAPVVFGALYVQIAYSPPIWAMLVVALPLVAGLSLGLMRPGKGLMIALQMRNNSSSPGGEDRPLTPTSAASPLHRPAGGPPPPVGED
ncbi:MAG TPA: DUF983 domain-containing protein [Brevundimonas sp.]|nr:DUF983 domain-containing protein [Brevundimonas sp.]